jgi:S1-C subfamily serine protease
MAQEMILKKLSQEFSEIVEQTSQSIVLVQGRRFPCSGIVWQKNLIIAPDHSISKEDHLQIRNSSGDLITATVAGRDPSLDIAILKTTEELHPPEIAAQEKLKAGQLMLAMGRANGGRVLATLTMISGTDENYRNWRGGTFDQFIRLDVSPYPGFSGSALVLPNGKIAGMNTSVFSRHFGLTIPASNIDRLVQRILTKGSIGKPYLGVRMQPIQIPEKMRQDHAVESGLLVVGTEQGSPAENAGVLVGDIVVRFDGKSLNSMSEIFLTEESIDKNINISIIRGGKLQELQIKVGERPSR